MAKFIFYHGLDRNYPDKIHSICNSYWNETAVIHHEAFWIFTPADHQFLNCSNTEYVLGAISGYIRLDNLPHASDQGVSLEVFQNQAFFTEVVDKQTWPLGSDWTGSFSAVGYSKTRREVILCNDLLGYPPLYYFILNDGLIGSTHIISLSQCISCQVDPVGVAQRITPIAYANYGRRTLIKNIHRLLPGEWVKFDFPNHSHPSRYDNSLYNGVLNSDVRSIARKTWDSAQREITLTSAIPKSIYLALSAGWDSRHVLAGLLHRGTTIHSFTYGNPNLHESKIARRCAKAAGSSQQCFGIEGKIFPPRDVLEKLVQETESTNYLVWIAIISEIQGKYDNSYILLHGDHSEGIDGRHLLSFSTREARIRSFINEILGRNETYIPVTSDNFMLWQSKKTKKIIEDVHQSYQLLSNELKVICEPDHLKSQLLNDLNLTFSRVEANMPPFLCQLDELLDWYSYVRYEVCSQILLMESNFRCFSPLLSMRQLRFISTVHPRFRRRRRLIREMALLPEFAQLARIPSGQIPYLNMYAPGILRDIMWGFRSWGDQILMRRLLHKKDPYARQRFLKSKDFIKEYRRNDSIDNVSSWFSGKWIDRQAYIEIAGQRANLTAWPLGNEDMSSPATASIILDLSNPSI